MMRLRRASAIATLSLLAWSATAYAECAWVLWRNDPRPVEGRPGYFWDQWQVVEAFTGIGGTMDSMMAKNGCNKRKQEAALALKEKSRTELVCLPDTVDPRGPKGK